jgi:chromate reductase
MTTIDSRALPATHVLAVCGSLRSRSYNRGMLIAAVECAPPGMAIDLFDTLAAVPSFNEDLEQATGGGPEAVRRLRERVAHADGLLIATPEYNQSMPGVLKNAIDWLSRPGPEEVLVGKPVAVIGASGGPWGTRLAQSMLRQALYATGSPVLPKPALFVREAAGLFDDAGRLVHPRTRELLRALLAAFGQWIALLSPEGHRAER